MWRASLLVVALATSALADTRDQLAQHLLDESASVDAALATVAEKLVTTDAERAKRLAAAYRTLHATTHDAMTAARRRAAARLLVDRDREERRLLAEELAELRAARARISDDVAKLSTVALPTALLRPAQGTIARKFGTLVHERSKAVLSRRGLDLEVEAKAAVVAPADGVVRYAGPIRGLDNGLVIDHGGYLTVLGKLGELAVPVGVPVKRGDRVGQAARHRAYIEVRVKIGPSGLPIDPEPLFAR